MNRIIPRTSPTRTSASGRTSRPSTSQTVHESFEPVPILDRAPVRPRDGRRRRCSRRWAQEVYGDLAVTDVLYRDDPIRVPASADGYVLSMRLPVRLARGHGHPPARRGAVRPRRALQAQPDPAADAPADGGPRRELRRGPSRDHLRVDRRDRSRRRRRVEGASMAETEAGHGATTTAGDGAAAPADTRSGRGGCGAAAARVHGRVLPDLHGGDRRARARRPTCSSTCWLPHASSSSPPAP